MCVWPVPGLASDPQEEALQHDHHGMHVSWYFLSLFLFTPTSPPRFPGLIVVSYGSR